MKTKEIAVVKAVLAGLWAPSAYAATVTLGSSLAAVPALAYALVVALSGISGLAALLAKLTDRAADGRGLGLFVAAHMLGSVLAGLLTFFVLSGAGGVNDFFQVVLISLGAYGGAAALDKLADAASSRVGAIINPGAKNDS